jgi:hypothetical protein
VFHHLFTSLSQTHVFSHDDVRPDNIIVKLEDGECRVTGIIDWKYGGFYPEYLLVHKSDERIVDDRGQ